MFKKTTTYGRRRVPLPSGSAINTTNTTATMGLAVPDVTDVKFTAHLPGNDGHVTAVEACMPGMGRKTQLHPRLPWLGQAACLTPCPGSLPAPCHRAACCTGRVPLDP